MNSRKLVKKGELATDIHLRMLYITTVYGLIGKIKPIMLESFHITPS
jgi:hypothetical protein